MVDVGGGWGTNLKLIVSKYPRIKAINLDLPQVIKDAHICPGIYIYISFKLINSLDLTYSLYSVW